MAATEISEKFPKGRNALATAARRRKQERVQTGPREILTPFRPIPLDVPEGMKPNEFFNSAENLARTWCTTTACCKTPRACCCIARRWATATSSTPR
jgi:hypothetical protein